MVPLVDHEIIVWEHRNIAIRLSASEGTSIDCQSTTLTLTNQFIHITASSPTTYRVANKGDRTFTSVKIPIRSARPHRFIQPWFGPYKWETLVSGKLHSDLEPTEAAWKLTLTFNNGGAFDYRTKFLEEFAKTAQAAQDGMDEPLPQYSEFE